MLWRGGKSRLSKFVIRFGSIAPSFELWGTAESRAAPGRAAAVRQRLCSCQTQRPGSAAIGQEAGIRTRTVRFTGGDAAVTPQS